MRVVGGVLTPKKVDWVGSPLYESKTNTMLLAPST